MSEDQEQSEYIVGGMAVKCGIMTQEQYEKSYYDHVENPETPYKTFLLEKNYLTEDQLQYVQQMVDEYYRRKGETEVPEEPGSGAQAGEEAAIAEPDSAETPVDEPDVMADVGDVEEEQDAGLDTEGGLEIGSEDSDEGGFPEMKTLPADAGSEEAGAPGLLEGEPSALEPAEEQFGAPGPPEEEAAEPEPAEEQFGAPGPPEEAAEPEPPEEQFEAPGPPEEAAEPEPPEEQLETPGSPEEEAASMDMDTPAELNVLDQGVAEAEPVPEAAEEPAGGEETGIDFDAGLETGVPEPAEEPAASEFPEAGKEPVTAQLILSNWQKKRLSEDTGESVECEAVVSTGSTDLALPADMIEKLDLKEIGEVDVRTSDGSIRRCRTFGMVEVETQGRSCQVRAVEIPRGAKPLLGSVPLQEMDFHILMAERKLIPNPESKDVPILYLY